MGQNMSHVSGLPDLITEVTIVLNHDDSEPTRFTAPQGLLKQHSVFFADACGSDRTQVIHLDDVEPEIFAWYLMWVYRGRVVIASDYDSEDEESVERVCSDLTKLWLMADKLKDERCRNAVMDNIVGAVDHHTRRLDTLMFSSSLITLIWSATMTCSPLRKIVLDYYLSHVCQNDIEFLFELLHPGFVKDLMFLALRRLEFGGLENRSPAEAVEAEPCFYHDHFYPVWRRYCVPEEDLIVGKTSRHTSLSANFDFTRNVTVVINPDESDHTATFTVPESLLVDKSEFFEAACRNEWKEATSRIIKIPDVDLDAFYAYMYWVYWEVVAITSDCRKTLRSAADSEPALNDLVELWLLADRFAETRLRDFTMDALRKVAHSIYSAEKDWTAAFTPAMTAHICSSTTGGRALRRFVVDVFESKVTEANLNGGKESFPPEFLVDLATKLMRMRGGEDNKVWAFYEAKCHYHEHEENNSLCGESRHRASGDDEDLWPYEEEYY